MEWIIPLYVALGGGFGLYSALQMKARNPMLTALIVSVVWLPAIAFYVLGAWTVWLSEKLTGKGVF